MLDIQNYINGIIKKKFSTRAKGYDPTEVDETLDRIFEKLTFFIKKVNDVNEENSVLSSKIFELKKENTDLKEENTKLKSFADEVGKSGFAQHNIMQRLNKLEAEKKTSTNNTKKMK